MINEAVGKIISESNNLNAQIIKYKNLFLNNIAGNVDNICAEIKKRDSLLEQNNLKVPLNLSMYLPKNLEKPSVQQAPRGTTFVNTRPNLYSGQNINEGLGIGIVPNIANKAAKIGKGALKMGAWIGVYNAMGAATSFLENKGISQNLKNYIEELQNEETLNAEGLLQPYEEATITLIGICNDIKKYPQLIGTNLNNIRQNIFNGPEEPKQTAYEIATEMVIPGISLAISFIPEIGMLAGFLLDVANEGIKLIGSAYHDERYCMRIIEQEYKYITQTASELIKVFATTNNNQFLNNAKAMVTTFQSQNPNLIQYKK